VRAVEEDANEVSRWAPSSASCTIPMHGLLAWGEIICCGTAMSSATLAVAHGDCIRCMFISSPSKSALYGLAHERLRRNVCPGTITTRWPIMPIRCSKGCRLKMTTSPSRM